MSSNQRRRVATLTLGLALIGSPGAGSEQGVATTRVGNQELTLQAKATRSIVFGTVDLYSVGIYAPEPLNEDQLRNGQLTKAVRIAVLYEGGMPQHIPTSWWEELVPPLSTEQQEKLRATFRKLSGREDIWVTYAPDRGTRMIHRGRTVLATGDHQFMNAVLDLWLDDTPVSQQVHDHLREALRR